jgi:hypothetical protein
VQSFSPDRLAAPNICFERRGQIRVVAGCAGSQGLIVEDQLEKVSQAPKPGFS